MVSTPIPAALRARRRAAPWLCWAALVLSAVVLPVLYQVLFEFVRTASVTTTLLYLEARPDRLLLGTFPLAAFYLFLAVATRRAWLADLVEGFALLAAAAVNLYKLQYRGEPLLPRDFLAVSEAAGVAGSLELRVTREMVLFALAILLSAAVLALFSPPPAKSRKRAALRAVCACVLLPAAVLYIFGVLGNEKVAQKYQLFPSVAGQATTAYRNTAVTNFFVMLTRLMPDTPEGYSEAAMQAILAEIDEMPAAAADTDADVVVILLESYFHLPDDPRVQYSAALTENYDRLAAEGVSGYLLADSYGGGTANIEFGVYTGFCYSYLPASSIPFAEFVYSDFPCYSQYLAGCGYATGSVHAYYDYFYSRNIAYPRMGIGQSVWMDSFVSPATPNGYISEQDSMEMVAQQYEALRAENPGSPVYLQCVTMQNHCDYPAGGYTGPDPVHIEAEGLGAEDTACLETIVSNLRDIDLAIGWLCDYFSTVDREVVLIFYGDHQAECGDGVFSNYFYGDLSGEARTLALYSTPFLIWSNRQKTGETVEGRLGNWQLEALAAARYGLPHPRYYDFLTEMRGTVAGYNAGYVLDGSGQLAGDGTAEQQAWLNRLELIQYDAIFGKRYITDALFAPGG